MPAAVRFGKRERASHSPLREVARNLRGELTRRDVLVGLFACVVLSALLVSFHYQQVPSYQVGEVAAESVRARQDAEYEDKAKTEEEQAIARERAPAIYDFDGIMIARILQDVSQAFETGRSVLDKKQVPPKGTLQPHVVQELRTELEPQLGRILPQDILPVFLQQRFNSLLEGRILRILDSVWRGCIVDDEDWTRFLQHQRQGIVIRDNTSPVERPLAEEYVARNRTDARQFLNQIQIEFPELSALDCAQLSAFLDRLLIPNLLYNQTETEKRRDTAANRVAPVMIRIEQGKTIVRQGEKVTPEVVAQLAALRNQQNPDQLFGQFAGFFLFITIFLYFLWRYLIQYQDRHRKIRNKILLILSVLFSVFILMRLLTWLIDILSDRVSIEAFRGPFGFYYIIPFAAGAVLVTLLGEVNLGIITSILIAALAGLFYGDIYIAAYALLGNLTGIYSVRHYKDRAAILKAGMIIGLMNMVGILGIDLIRQAPLAVAPILLRLGFGIMGGALAATVASMLLPTLESIFKITTDIRLIELSNLNAPMLRRLAVEAPGTYHHSLMVGTLAESAAEAIGGNPLLVRVGAYYHDLGKMHKPEYFVENQVFGINKHETLSPNMSCLIIASHVKDGLELAKEARLTQDIRDLIPQHHGTRIMTYFYRKALDSNSGKIQEIDEVDFRYPGPKPQTKEAAILMMADSVEAASRTLTDPSPAQIRGMIDRLTDSILTDNQMDECDITLREINLVKESFFKALTSIYHRRIEYPGYDFKTSEEQSDRISVANSSTKHAKAM
jgi:putative nucleotidyltransferase with HDIG domain